MTKQTYYYIGYGAKNNGLISKEKQFTILNKNSDLSVISHQYLEEKQLLKIKYKKNFYSFRLNLIGDDRIEESKSGYHFDS